MRTSSGRHDVPELGPPSCHRSPFLVISLTCRPGGAAKRTLCNAEHAMLLTHARPSPSLFCCSTGATSAWWLTLQKTWFVIGFFCSRGAAESRWPEILFLPGGSSGEKHNSDVGVERLHFTPTSTVLLHAYVPVLHQTNLLPSHLIWSVLSFLFLSRSLHLPTSPWLSHVYCMLLPASV